MPKSPSSSAQEARKAIAHRLREIRVDAGLTAIQLARGAGWHRTKVSHLEAARRAASAEDVRTWCRICDASDEAEDLVESVRAATGMWIEWRRMERTGLRHAQRSVLPLMERTSRFHSYASWLLPGLLQVEAYTREVLRATQQRRRLRDDVDDAVQVRMERHALLHQPGKTFLFLIEETLLRNGMGGAELMGDQLAHLLEASRLPSVAIGIVPISPARMQRPAENFTIYDGQQVNVELVSGYLTLTRSSEIALYEDVFRLLADEAVFGADARRLIQEAANALI